MVEEKYRKKTIGIVGGGQLGRMLGQAGIDLGYSFRFLDPSAESPAKDVGELVVGPYADPDSLELFTEKLDVASFEFENVPAETIEFLSKNVETFPAAIALAVSQDRLREKELFEKSGIDCAEYRKVDGPEDLEQALDALGCPAILKTRRLGYDGKGQILISEKNQAKDAFSYLGNVPLILEKVVPFDREISVLAARGAGGGVVVWPLVWNIHRKGILRFSVPLTEGEAGQAFGQAREIAKKILDEFDYRGVLAVETFEKDGRLVANEIAPRVHNSGHWTIEGAETSQFKNHINALMGHELGSTALRGRSLMVNLIGKSPDIEEVNGIEGAHIHLYGKEPREGRKIGHVTLCAQSKGELLKRAESYIGLIEDDDLPDYLRILSWLGRR